MNFGAPSCTPVSITAKSTSRLSAATMQITMLITVPAGVGCVQKRRCVPNSARIHPTRYTTPMASVAATTTRTSRRPTFTSRNT